MNARFHLQVALSSHRWFEKMTNIEAAANIKSLFSCIISDIHVHVGKSIGLTVDISSMLREVVISALGILSQLTQESISLSVSTVKAYGMYR